MRKLAATDRHYLTSLSHSFTLDCNIYVRSRIAAERVMKSVTNFLAEKLHLQVNEQKSAVARVWERKFLGYTMSWHRKPKLTIARQSVDKLKVKLREHFHKARGRNLDKSIKELTPLLRGWVNTSDWQRSRISLKTLMVGFAADIEISFGGNGNDQKQEQRI
jgi:hypothetical protein